MWSRRGSSRLQSDTTSGAGHRERRGSGAGLTTAASACSGDSVGVALNLPAGHPWRRTTRPTTTTRSAGHSGSPPDTSAPGPSRPAAAPRSTARSACPPGTIAPDSSIYSGNPVSGTFSLPAGRHRAGLSAYRSNSIGGALSLSAGHHRGGPSTASSNSISGTLRLPTGHHRHGLKPRRGRAGACRSSPAEAAIASSRRGGAPGSSRPTGLARRTDRLSRRSTQSSSRMRQAVRRVPTGIRAVGSAFPGRHPASGTSLTRPRFGWPAPSGAGPLAQHGIRVRPSCGLRACGPAWLLPVRPPRPGVPRNRR